MWGGSALVSLFPTKLSVESHANLKVHCTINFYNGYRCSEVLVFSTFFSFSFFFLLYLILTQMQEKLDDICAELHGISHRNQDTSLLQIPHSILPETQEKPTPRSLSHQ